MKQKYAFLDRDGTLIFEPRDTYKIDTLERLKILPSVIESLKTLIKNGYKLILISNQDGIGTEEFTQEDFDIPQNKMLEIFKENAINFDEIFICPHTEKENCKCRKPRTGLVDEFFKNREIDMENSFVCGDRNTDGQFAKNLGIRFIKTDTNGPFRPIIK